MDFGIDFGTTNSACIGFEKGRERGIKFTDGFGNPFPSIVIIDPLTGNTYNGRKAWRRREELAESCIVVPSIKTYLATEMSWNGGGKTWTPEMIASQVFIGLKERVKATQPQNPLKSAVVAVPVGFSAKKRTSLRKAARIAGIEIKNFISEPTAAFFKHYNEIGHYSKIGVFDWGGGTLDVAVIENRKGNIKELGAGSLSIGGDDIDRKIAEWVHGQVAEQKNVSIPFDSMPANDRDRLIFKCEQAKKDLSDSEQVEIRDLQYGIFGGFRVVLNIDKLRGLVSKEVNCSIKFFEKIVEEADLNFDELGCILMVGGSVNLRPFTELISKQWESKSFFPLDSEWSVAHGGAILSGNPGKYVFSQSVGVIMSDGNFLPLVRDGDIFQKGKKEVFSFALVEDSPTANFIFSDEKEKILGYLNVPSFGFFREKIDLKVSMTEDLTISVEAKSQNRVPQTERKLNITNLRMNYSLPLNNSVVKDYG